LINASSMFEFHMLVVAAIIFYILKLSMEIVPNYPTTCALTFASHKCLNMKCIDEQIDYLVQVPNMEKIL
jgi:hypothetical protein